MMMKKILDNIGVVVLGRIVYWLYLEWDAKTAAEMPSVMHAKRMKAKKYSPL
jgi:hypothetical protein